MKAYLLLAGWFFIGMGCGTTFGAFDGSWVWVVVYIMSVEVVLWQVRWGVLLARRLEALV